MKILKLNLKKNNKKEIDSCINLAIKIINAGGLVIYPTETTYGIGSDPQQSQAIDKLLKYKSRREGKPLSIAVNNQEVASKYVLLNQQAKNFYRQFLPGPYTIISKLKNNSHIDSRVASEFGTLGIRIPDYPLILQLLNRLGRGVTATSANASGKKRPYQIGDILNNLSDRQKKLIDLIIDVGPLPKNEPSIVIDTTLSTPLTMRGHLQKRNPAIEFKSQSEKETKDLAMRLVLKNWQNLKDKGLLFALNGELGMGKTIFAKGVANFLQIEEEITSPTYNYLNEYSYKSHGNKGMFYHLDAWKIDQKEEFELLSVEKLFKANNILLIEWWDKIKNYLPKNISQQAIVLDLDGQDNWRIIKLWEENKI